MKNRHTKITKSNTNNQIKSQKRTERGEGKEQEGRRRKKKSEKDQHREIIALFLPFGPPSLAFCFIAYCTRGKKKEEEKT
jgi:hypothetical protein